MSDIVKKVYFTCKKLLYNDGTVRTYCQCDGCFGIGTVNVVKLPKTLYWDHKKLTTKYTTRWYCDKCIGKLYKSIQANRLKYLFDADYEDVLDECMLNQITRELKEEKNDD